MYKKARKYGLLCSIAHGLKSRKTSFYVLDLLAHLLDKDFKLYT